MATMGGPADGSGAMDGLQVQQLSDHDHPDRAEDCAVLVDSSATDGSAGAAPGPGPRLDP